MKRRSDAERTERERRDKILEEFRLDLERKLGWDEPLPGLTDAESRQKRYDDFRDELERKLERDE